MVTKRRKILRPVVDILSLLIILIVPICVCNFLCLELRNFLISLLKGPSRCQWYFVKHEFTFDMHFWVILAIFEFMANFHAEPYFFIFPRPDCSAEISPQLKFTNYFLITYCWFSPLWICIMNKMVKLNFKLFWVILMDFCHFQTHIDKT